MGRVYANGSVFDGIRHRGSCAVGVRGGRIVAVGDLGEVREHAGPGADEIDVAGGLVLPGFIDGHMHPMVGGLERLRCEMTSLSSREEYLDAIRSHAQAHPGKGWFRAGGWSASAFGPAGPTREDLDAVLPDRPAFITSSDHHDAWVNSRALEITGVGADTPDPDDGWFERDAHGRPTGTVREAAMAMVGDHVDTSREEYYQGLLEAQSYLHSLGITGWHDALIGGYAGIDDPTQAYLDALGAGSLTARVRASQWWDRHRGVEQVDDLVAQRERLAEAGLDAGSVKFMVDGIAETFTAAVTIPYTGDLHCRCGDRGLAFMSTEQLNAAVVAVDAAGLEAHFHAIGDRAVHDALNAVEHARRVNTMSDRRHQIAHLQLVRPEDRPRFRSLAVAANAEGMWARRETPAVQMLLAHLDEERVGWHYPFADIAAGGVPLAGGSDWPVNPPEPIQAIHVLVNRREYVPDGPATDPLCPEQAIGLEQAMAAYTSGSAYVNRWHDQGSIQVGARADLITVDRDPFACPSEQIGAASVTSVYTGDQQVHPS
ncbi:MAG TPA: amidohydrolase [Nocardioidaceae bacterium]|nr:amidohydrolase [Nocardioidaceae bacterium]